MKNRKQQAKIALELKAKHQLADDLLLATRAVSAWNKAEKLGDKKAEREAEQLAKESSRRVTEHTGYYLDGADDTPKDFAESIYEVKQLDLQPNKLTGIREHQERVKRERIG
jgi:hypothetical protein